VTDHELTPVGVAELATGKKAVDPASAKYQPLGNTVSVRQRLGMAGQCRFDLRLGLPRRPGNRLAPWAGNESRDGTKWHCKPTPTTAVSPRSGNPGFGRGNPWPSTRRFTGNHASSVHPGCRPAARGSCFVVVATSSALRRSVAPPCSTSSNVTRRRVRWFGALRSVRPAAPNVTDGRRCLERA
jgi:hypothetical protein